MTDVSKTFIVWVLAVPIILMIIFVRAGQYGGATGGSQTATIIKAGASGLGGLASDLNGGKNG